MLTNLFLIAFTLLQDPAYSWSEQTDHDYWRAVHLLEVEGQADQAAELLLALAEREDVAATAGQAALVKARAVQALGAAGRGQEASRLFPLVALEARDTAFEAEVEQVLANCIAWAQDPAGLDPDFAKLLIEQVSDNRGRDWSHLRNYGRHLLPYGEHFLTELEQGRVGLTPVQRILTVALPSCDAAFVQTLLQRTKEMPGPTLTGLLDRAIMEFEPQEEGAADALDQFLIALSRDEDISRARAGVEWMAQTEASRGSEAIRERLGEILASTDDLLAPFAVNKLVFRAQQGTQLGYEAAVCPQSMVAHYARQKIFEIGDAETYARIDAGLDVVDRRRLAWLLVPEQSSGTNWQSATGHHYRVGSAGYVARYVADGSEEAFRPIGGRMKERKLQPDRDRWAAVIEPLLADEDALTRRLAALAAVGHGAWELVDRALQDSDPELRMLCVSSLAHYHYPESFDDHLVRMLGDEELAELSARALELHSFRLSFEQAVLADAHGFAVSGLQRSFRRWMEEGKEEQLQLWMRDRDRSAESRKRAAELLLERGLANGLAVIEVMPELVLTAQEEVNFHSALTGRWAQNVGEEATLRGFLEPEESQALLDLAQEAAVREEKGRAPALSQNWSDALRGMIHAEVEGAMEIYLTLATDDSTRSWLAVHSKPPLAPMDAVLQVVEIWLSEDARGLENYDLRHFFMTGRNGFHCAPETKLAVAYAVLESSDDALLIRDALGYLGRSEVLSPDQEGLLMRFLARPGHATTVAKLLVKTPSSVDYVPALLQAWELEGLRDRSGLLRAIGNTLDERVVPVLLEALTDRNELVAEAATECLERMRNVREQRQTWEAWQRYGMHQSPTAALLDKLGSENQEVRLAAIASLGTLKAVEALPFLIELLEEEDEGIADAARKALANINADS